MNQVFVAASFDDLRAPNMRLLQEAAKLGKVHVLLWSDEAVRAMAGSDPKFPQEERQYLVESIRYVDRIFLVDATDRDNLPTESIARGHIAPGACWAVEESPRLPAQQAFCRRHDFECCVISEQQLRDYPEPDESTETPSTRQKKVLVTGCYDWFHSGHVRFFEEVSELGEVHVVVGHDANIKLLKGAGHPMYPEAERRYMAGSIRFVKRAYVSSGNGWLDAEPEIEIIKPDIYAVNEDGDVPRNEISARIMGSNTAYSSDFPKKVCPNGKAPTCVDIELKV